MPARTDVCEGGRVFQYTFSDPLTWAEINQAQMHARAYYDNAPYKVHVMFDVRSLKSLPEGFLRVRGNAELSHPKCGELVIIGSSVLLQLMGETVFRLARFNRAHFFQSRQMGEAWNYLRSIVARDSSNIVKSVN